VFGSGPARYSVPGDVMLVLATALSQAFDGLRLAALAAREDNGPAIVASLQHMHSRLDLIHETLLAVVGEHEGTTDGSQRLH